MARVIATSFYRSAGVDDPEDLSALAEEMIMTLKTFEKNLNRAKQAYIDQLMHLNGKKQTRCKPYDHSSKWDAYRRLIWEVLHLIKRGETEKAKTTQQAADVIKATYELQRKEEIMKAPVMAHQFGRASPIANRSHNSDRALC
jgi:hypothetical protein